MVAHGKGDDLEIAALAGPEPPQHAGLALELVAFLAAGAEQEPRLAGGAQAEGAELLGELRRQIEGPARLDEAQRLQIVDAADQHRAVDDVLRQIGLELRPERRQQHGGDMGAGGMAGDLDLAGRKAQPLALAPEEGQRQPRMADDAGEGNIRAERVAEHGDRQPRLGQALGHEAEIGLAEGLPIAAVDIDMQARRGRLGQEEVESRGGILGIGDVELGARGGAEGGAALLPALEELRGLRHAAAGVVLQPKLVGGHVAVERLDHAGNSRSYWTRWMRSPGSTATSPLPLR